jgi:hypothetical protein
MLLCLHSDLPHWEDVCSLLSNGLRASLLEEYIADMNPVLRDLRKLIDKWNKDCQSKLQQLRFAFQYTSELKSLQEELGGLFTRTRDLLSLLSTGNIIFLRKQAEADKIQHQKDHKARENRDAQVRSLLLQILNEKGEEKISAAAISSDTSSWEQLEEDLQAKGLSQTQVRQLMDPIKMEINRITTPRPQKSPPLHPKKSAQLAKPSPKPPGRLSPNPDSPRTAHRSPSPQPQSAHKPSPTILVVDRTNGGKDTSS